MKALGWAVTGAVAGLLASAAAGVLATDRDARRRLAVSARQVRDRVEETSERWTAGASIARDRLAGTTEELRDRVVGTADQWRERQSESVGRALQSAAEARDAMLEDDADSDDAGADLPS